MGPQTKPLNLPISWGSLLGGLPPTVTPQEAGMRIPNSTRGGCHILGLQLP